MQLIHGRPGLFLLDDATRGRLHALVTAHGLAGAARVLGLSRGVVSAALAGTGLRKGSVELLSDALKRKVK